MYFSEQGNADDDATLITIFLASFNLQSCCLMQSAVCSLQSAVCSLQMSYTDFGAIPKCEVNSLLVLLVFAFFAVTNFFHGNVELTFSFLMVLRLSLHAVYYAKNETSEHVPRCQTFCLCVSV